MATTDQELRTPTAGWYPDPEQPGGQRYWDGQQWGDRLPGSDGTTPLATKKPFYRRRWFYVLAVILLLAAVGSSLDNSTTPASDGGATTSTETDVDTADSDNDTTASTTTDNTATDSEDESSLVADEPAPAKPPVPEPVLVKVPNVTGDKIAGARERLSKKSLEVSVRERATDNEPPGTILRQSPAAGHKVEEGDVITLIVAKEPPLTRGQENALRSASDYLDYSAFSRSGLIKQLEFEGYSTADATFAVDALNVNWKEQAAKTAEDYLEYSSFSHSGLVEQLEFEGYTRNQAEYGVAQTGL